MKMILSQIFDFPINSSKLSIEEIYSYPLKGSFIDFISDTYELAYSNGAEEPNLCYAHSTNLREGFKSHYSKLDVIKYIQHNIVHNSSDIYQAEIIFNKDYLHL